MDFTVIIPARYASSRLPGKPLVNIAGKPMVQHVYERALASGAQAVWIATDDERIVSAVQAFSDNVLMTAKTHQSGTERLSEVIELLELSSDEIIVNVQGDEPLIPIANIQQVAAQLAHNEAPMATLSVPINNYDELANPNIVKVVIDKRGRALYFSRAMIPYDRQHFMQQQQIIDSPLYQRHIGIYAYRTGFIQQYLAWPSSQLEQLESLEQLRVLWHGESIMVAQAKEIPPPGIDTPEDLAHIQQLLA